MTRNYAVFVAVVALFAADDVDASIIKLSFVGTVTNYEGAPPYDITGDVFNGELSFNSSYFALSSSSTSSSEYFHQVSMPYGPFGKDVVYSYTIPQAPGQLHSGGEYGGGYIDLSSGNPNSVSFNLEPAHRSYFNLTISSSTPLFSDLNNLASLEFDLAAANLGTGSVNTPGGSIAYDFSISSIRSSVTAVSAVPLPASLQLFGLTLVGLEFRGQSSGDTTPNTARTVGSKPPRAIR